MDAYAYGASLHGENGTFSESITPELLYIKTIDLREPEAMERVISYHRKCVSFAIEHAFVTSQVQTNNTAVERMLLSGISNAYQYNDSRSIYIRSAFVDDKTYLRHQFTPLKAGYFYNLYMEL